MSALLEFLEHGLKYVFPARLGPPSRGMATAWASPSLAGRVVSGEADKPVWPSPEGDERGGAVAPLYESAPGAARRNPKLYAALACIDAIQIGRAREKKVAVDDLQSLLRA